MKSSFLPMIQKRAARVAVGASTVRGQGAPGMVLAAREYLADLQLERFVAGDERAFRRRLDRATIDLMKSLPKRGRSWGIARKVLNIFLRDALYTGYLARGYRLGRIEHFLEVPLDSISAKSITADVLRRSVPRWRTVRNLTPEDSDRFQDAARGIARRHGVARVHMDAVWWGDRRLP
jgi:hypothetical protein